MNYLEDCVHNNIMKRINESLDNLESKKTYINLSNKIQPGVITSSVNTYAKQISDIVHGKIPKGNKSYISENLLLDMSKYLKVSKAEFLFGDKTEIEKLVYTLYLNIVYSFNTTDFRNEESCQFDEEWSNYMNYYYLPLIELDAEYTKRLKSNLNNGRISKSAFQNSKDIKEIQKDINQCLLFNAELAYKFSLCRISVLKDFAFLGDDDEYIGITTLPIHEIDENLKFVYDETVVKLWVQIKDKMISSFKDKFFKDEINYLDFTKQVIQWIREDFSKIILNQKIWLMSDKVSSLGFTVYEEMEKLRFLEREYLVSFGEIGFELEEQDQAFIDSQVNFMENLSNIIIENMRGKVQLQKDFCHLIQKSIDFQNRREEDFHRRFGNESY